MSGPIRRAAVLVPLLVCACYSRRVPLMMQVSRELPSPCWVVLQGGGRIQLDQARLTPDSVVGWRHEGGRVAVAREMVVAVEEREGKPGDAVVLIPMMTGVVFMVGIMVLLVDLAIKLARHPH
jgi:hypothetical protein